MRSDMKSVCISHNGVYVTYYSADGEEIDAIGDCYRYFWTLEDSSNAAEGWSVVSHRVSSIKDIMDVNEPAGSAGLFKDVSLKKTIIGKKHYYFHDMRNGACLTCFDVENRTTHFYHEHDSDHSYIRNLVREPAAARYKEAGHILLHASACSIDGKAVLMPGLKGAGKSTLLSHLLESGAHYIANDAVLCVKENDSIVLTAYPQCVRLSKETIQNNKSLSEHFYSAERYNFIDNKFEFLPSLFDDIFSMHRLSFVSKLELIVIPSLDLSSTDYSMEVSDNDIELPLLQESMFYPCHNYTWSPFFHGLNDPQIDISNLANVFKPVPRICYLKYGILDNHQQKKLFSDISSIMSAASTEARSG